MSYGLTRSLKEKRHELLKCSNVDGNNFRLLPSVFVIVLYIESSMPISDNENVTFVGPTHINIVPKYSIAYLSTFDVFNLCD